MWLPLLLEAKTKAFDAMELQRVLAGLNSLLEYEWLTGQRFVEQSHRLCDRSDQKTGSLYVNSEFDFWLVKVRQQAGAASGVYEGYRVDNPKWP